MRLRQPVLGWVSFVLLFTACRHAPPADVDSWQDSCPIDPYGAILVVLDKQGNNLITSLNDVVTTTPISSTYTQIIPNYIFRLRQNSQDTTLSTKYGGKGLAIGSTIPARSLEGRPDRTPINNFMLSINGKPIGQLFCSVKSLSYADGCFSPTTVLFNDQTIPVDSTVVPRAYVIRLKE